MFAFSAAVDRFGATSTQLGPTVPGDDPQLNNVGIRLGAGRRSDVYVAPHRHTILMCASLRTAQESFRSAHLVEIG